MPELPEVETTRRGLAPLIENRQIAHITIHNPRLRHPVDQTRLHALKNARFTTPARRGKYLWLHTDRPEESLLIHLGMSGSLRVNPPRTPRKTHDHIEITLDNQHILRLHDPRRFGMLNVENPNAPPAYLQTLGAEPLSDTFTPAYLLAHMQGRESAIKTRLMNQNIVVGVGNIYASEALFKSGIDPRRPAKTLNINEAETLVAAVKTILTHAIAVGGTTLRDFIHSDGSPGYFQQTLNVYGKSGQPCPQCQTPLASAQIGGRTTTYCPNCQR
ncbi:MAG: bifunctional DNA-formamidopyrimidine glycosylase/DNA-(apurinic or apyrimidinic site) lyase [Cardiobacteriaceae bacterium]|nr:bifunctional DNA-formamidopyrimidine glycosylase/DNA-(apurinic or apyrimidinic site) lyase [Cardiobacteriaceae bacterium]